MIVNRKYRDITLSVQQKYDFFFINGDHAERSSRHDQEHTTRFPASRKLVDRR